MRELSLEEGDIDKYIAFSRTIWVYVREENHAIYGVASEIGELMNAYKRVDGPGKQLNVVNVNQECGDCFYFLCQIVYMHKLDRKCLIPIRISTEGLDTRKLTFAMMKEAVRMNDLLLNNDYSSYLTGSIHTIVNYLNVVVKSIGLTMEQCMRTNFMHLTRAYEIRSRYEKRDIEAENKYLEELTIQCIIDNEEARQGL